MSSIYYVKSSEDMSELLDDSVDLIITSPPEIRWYDAEAQRFQYPGSLVRIFNECYRVLRPGGFFVLNVGTRVLEEAPLRDTKNVMHAHIFYPFLAAEIIRSHTSFIPIGDMIGVYPEGFSKTAKIIELAKLQFGFSYEHWFVFAKGHWKLKYPGVPNVFHMTPLIFCFDEKAISHIIDLFSEEGDIILDPCAGSGTAGKVANQMERDAIMYDVYSSHLEEVKRNIPHVKVVRKDE